MIDVIYKIYDVMSQIGGFVAFILVTFAIIKLLTQTDEEEDE